MRRSIEERSFPKFELTETKKQQILQNIRARQNKRVKKPLWRPVLHTVLITLILLGFTTVLLDEFNRKQSGGAPQEEFSISLPTGVELIEKNGEHILMSNEQIVGGIKLVTEEEMNSFFSTAAIFEQGEVMDAPYKTIMALEHVKTKDVLQTYHYFISVNNETTYELYFHTPFFERESIEEIVLSFQYKR